MNSLFETVEPAKILWSQEDLFEDAERHGKVWRAAQEDPSERKLSNYEAFLAMPSESAPGTKALRTEWEPIGNGIHGGTTGNHRTGRIRAAPTRRTVSLTRV